MSHPPDDRYENIQPTPVVTPQAVQQEQPLIQQAPLVQQAPVLQKEPSITQQVPIVQQVPQAAHIPQELIIARDQQLPQGLIMSQNQPAQPQVIIQGAIPKKTLKSCQVSGSIPQDQRDPKRFYCEKCPHNYSTKADFKKHHSSCLSGTYQYFCLEVKCG